MNKLRRLLDIFLILIYFTFTYAHHDQPLANQQALATNPDPASQTRPKTTTTTTTNSDLLRGESSPSERDKRKFVDDSKDAITKLLNLKERPSDAITTSNTKFYVPRAMLEKYMEFRDTVRDFIPEDREFFGKLDLDGMEDSHEKFWNDVYEKSGSYDLEVDMRQPSTNSEEAKRARLKGDVDHMVHIRLAKDPDEIPASIEPQLPPHVTSTRNQKQYISVHLRFNLSQELYSNLNTEEDLRHADLHLSRDKVSGCLFERCRRKPILFFKRDNSTRLNQSRSRNQVSSGLRNTNDETSNLIKHIEPLYQRIYVLLVTGYDAFQEPTTTVFTTYRIDTRTTGPLVIDISRAVRGWIREPKTNYGIIVRVRNDDELYERQKTAKQESTGHSKTASKATNASDTDTDTDTDPDASISEITFLEQVRLKRGIGQVSDDDDTWLRKQPYIIAFSKPLDQERHVKRHTNLDEDDTDGMQADDPSVATDQYQQTTTSTTSTSIPSAANGRDTIGQTDKPSSANTQTTTFESVIKREHIPTVNNGRRSQSSRAPGNGRASSLQQGSSSSRPKGKAKPSIRQPDKCSKKPLKINFDEVGWSSWIIAPHSYYANFCSGECTWPLSDTQNATNHAIIQAIYHSVGRVVPKSCCAPVKLARMAILYQLDGVVQMRQYDDMIIEACGCL